MGLFDLFRGNEGLSAADTTRDASDDRWFGVGSVRTEIDVHVSVARARRVPVVRSCIKCNADAVAGLQFGVFERVGPARVERQDDHPIARLLENPNPRQTGFEFIYSIVDDLLAEGNFYAEPQFDDDGTLTALWRLEPSRMQVEELRDRSKRFRYTDKWGAQRVWVEGEVWHVPLPPLIDDIRGSSPILTDGREAVAVAIALQRYANILFTNDGTPPYVFTVEGAMSTESKDNWLRAWSRRMTGANRHRPAIGEHGMKPHRLGLTAEEAQFLETRRELWLDLCRLWRTPPHKVGILDKATFSNIEHQSLEFVTDTLRPILELIERSVTKYLIGRPGTYFEFNVESLLRGDIKARYEAYALGRQWGWLSVNDILRKENANGIGKAGDRYVEPLNMVPVGTGEAERQPDQRKSTENAIAFLRKSVARAGGRTRLELVKDAA